MRIQAAGWFELRPWDPADTADIAVNISWRRATVVRQLETLVVEVFFLNAVDTSYRPTLCRRRRLLKAARQVSHDVVVVGTTRPTVKLRHVVEV